MTKLTHYQSWEISGASFCPGNHRHRFAGLFPVLPDLAAFCRARASTPREGQRGKVTPAKSQPLVIYDLRFEKYFANRVAKLAKRQRTPSREIFSLHRCKRCSLNETLDSPEVQKISEEFAQALQDVLENHEDAVGVAIVINGKIEEVNIYPNHSLLKKLYPRLLESYALQATLEHDKAKEAKTVEPADIVKFMTEDKSKPRRQQSINADNTASMVFDSEEEGATTYYKGGAVHRQVLRKQSPSGEK